MSILLALLAIIGVFLGIGLGGIAIASLVGIFTIGPFIIMAMILFKVFKRIFKK